MCGRAVGSEKAVAAAAAEAIVRRYGAIDPCQQQKKKQEGRRVCPSRGRVRVSTGT